MWHVISGRHLYFHLPEASIQCRSSDRLGKIETGNIGSSNFVRPLAIFYELDGKQRKWDMVTTHPRCHCTAGAHPI